MPSFLPIDLAQRVFASYPAPLAEAVWALETASSPEDRFEHLGMVTRTLLRLVSATALAARLQRGTASSGDSRRARELLEAWKSSLLTDAQWIELIRELLRAPPPDFPLPKLVELVQGADGVRFIMALKQLLAVEPNASLEEPLAQLAWVLAHMEGVWSQTRVVVPHAPPADPDARQPMQDLTGIADAAPFSEGELASHVRLPADRPVLATPEGKPLLALFPVVQWLRDVPGLGDALFFFDGCEPEAEVLRAYPSLVEYRVPRPKVVIPPEQIARAKARRRAMQAVALTLAAAAIGAGGWRYHRSYVARAAERARLEAARRLEEADRAAEAAFKAETAQALARVAEALRQGDQAIPHRVRWQQGTLQRLTEALVHGGTPAARDELLDARIKDRAASWRAVPQAALAVSADGRFFVSQEKDSPGTIARGIAESPRTITSSIQAELLTPLAHGASFLVSESNRVCLWNLDGQDPCRTVSESPSHVLAASSDGATFAADVDDYSIELRDLEKGKVLKTLKEHHGRITGLAFTPDGRTLVSASEDGLVLLWDVKKGRERSRLGRPKDPAIEAMAVSANGRTLATVGADKQLRLWSIGSGEELRSFTLNEIPRSLFFLPDGQTLVYALGKEILFVDTTTGLPTAKIEGHSSPISRLLLSDDARWLLAVGTDGTTRLWDLSPPPPARALPVASPDAVAFAPDGSGVATANGDVVRWTSEGVGTRVLEGMPADHLTFHGVAYAPDGSALLAGDDSCAISVWQAKQPVRRWQKRVPCTAPAGSLVFSRGGARLAQVTGNSVTLWDPSRGAELWTKTLRGPVKSVAFSTDGGLLAASDGDVSVWKTATGNEVRHWSPSGEALAFTADGKLVVASAGEVAGWNPMTGQKLETWAACGDAIQHLVVSPQGESLFGAGAQGVWWWDTASHRLRGRLPDAPAGVKALAVAPDGRTLMAGAQLVWLPEAFGPEARAVAPGKDVLTTAAYSLDGKLLATAGADKTIRLLDARTGTEVRRLKGQTDAVARLVFAPDGKTLAAGAEDSIRLWDLASGEETRTIATAAPATELAFIENGKQIVAAVGSGILVWDAETGEKLRSLEGHTAPIVSLSVAVPSRAVASASSDGTVKLWDAEAGELSAEIRPPLGTVTATAYSVDGHILALGRDDGQLMLRARGTNGAWFASHGGGVKALTFSPDGKLLLSAGTDKSLTLWQLTGDTEAKELFTLHALAQPASSVTFSPDGAWFASVGGDAAVHLWNLAALRSFFTASPQALLVEVQPQQSPASAPEGLARSGLH